MKSGPVDMKMSEDMYKEIARKYDQFHGKYGEYDPAVRVFFVRLFADYQIKSVLDCACGTGHHLPLFHSLNCEVVGSDISEAMLRRAKKNLDEYGLELPLHKADYRELPHYFKRRSGKVVELQWI